MPLRHQNPPPQQPLHDQPRAHRPKPPAQQIDPVQNCRVIAGKVCFAQPFRAMCEGMEIEITPDLGVERAWDEIDPRGDPEQDYGERVDRHPFGDHHRYDGVQDPQTHAQQQGACEGRGRHGGVLGHEVHVKAHQDQHQTAHHAGADDHFDENSGQEDVEDADGGKGQKGPVHHQTEHHEPGGV